MKMSSLLEMEALFEKLKYKDNQSIIQKRYYYSEKGQAKLKRQNEKRRMKTLRLHEEKSQENKL